MTKLPKAVAVSALLALLPGMAAAQTRPDSLTLDHVLDLVRERNPRLQAMRAAAEGAAYRAPEASTLPDPVFQLGVMNFGLPSLNADMPTSMAPSVQLMQMIPFPGKLSLKGEIASYDQEMAGTAVGEMEWQMRSMASSMFFDLYALDRRLGVMERTLSLLQDFQQVAKAMYASGMGRQTDALRADVEVARMDGDIRSMRAMRTTMAARLNGMLDRPADTPVPSPALGQLPATLPPADTLNAWATGSRPFLTEGRLGVAQAGSRVELARRELWPDVTLGLSYGQRDLGMGTERMGSVMVGFSLPVFASRRQSAMKDEALAMERMARAELGSRHAEVQSQVGALVAELDRARSLARLYSEEVIPEARATVESALSSYRVGAVDFMTLVDAQMTLNQFEGELFQLLGDYGKAFTALESVVGRTLPLSDPTLAEPR
ncbi:MAG TPA: TolC family protein [Longimicrobiales bacterium]|nr:TolC family protein [Longimicrobiales bacterium]